MGNIDCDTFTMKTDIITTQIKDISTIPKKKKLGIPSQDVDKWRENSLSI